MFDAVLVELATMAGLVVVPLATEEAAGYFELVEELDEELAVELAGLVEYDDMIAPASEIMI